MAGKRPPNAEATQFRSGDEAVKNGTKGGIASGKKRRERKTVQKILNDYLDGNASNVKILAANAKQLGLGDDASVKEVITLGLLMNSLKDGDLSDLEKLMKLLGEQREVTNSEEKLDKLLEEFKNAVKPETT